MTQNGEHKLTVNGVKKGRPGKGRVLSLEQRKRCYAQHAMTEENTFRYTSKATEKNSNPLQRAWCKRCRADSRKRSRAKRLLEAKAVARQQRKEAKAQLDAVLPKAKGKGRKPTRAQELTAQSIDKAIAKINDNVQCGDCRQTFPDALTASEHIAGGTCKGVKVAAKGKVATKGKAA
jgi:hypothetical protein